MRCWHYSLLPYLPKSQLLAQKRECDFDDETYNNLYIFVNKELNNILDDINNKL